MARPIKEGLDYFSFDCDFYENKKVRKIMRACGPAAGSILSCLLCNIYRWKGYYILWDDDLTFDIADKIGVSEGAVMEVINKALQVDFFNQGRYDAHKILTSTEIQNRYKSATGKRNESSIKDDYLVIDGRNEVIDGRNFDNAGINSQSKVKKSKEEERENSPPVFFKIEDCFTIALKDLRWIKANKTSAAELAEFNRLLESRGEYEKNPMDYKSHFSNWKRKGKKFDDQAKTDQSVSVQKLKDQRSQQILNDSQ